VWFEPLNPVTPGHLLVIPVRHVMDAAEDPDLTGRVFAAAARIARESGGDPSCNLITSVGGAATQSVYHLHAHVVPRRHGDGLRLPWTQQPHKEAMP
jgi:histidine triad (HIT) family protein